MLAGIQNGGNGLVDSGNTYSTNLEIYENLIIDPFKLAVIDFVNRVLTFNGITDSDLTIKSKAVLSKDIDLSIIADFFDEEVLAEKLGIDKKFLKDKNTSVTPDEPDTGI
jgi:hypothetical protein